jgi:transposase
VGPNKSSAASYFQRLRTLIALQIEQEAQEVFGGESEGDESYFGGTGKGNRGRGAAGKISVFGLLKRGGRVYTKIIPEVSLASLLPIMARKVILDSIVYSGCGRGYNVLDVSAFKHYRIKRSRLFSDKKNHINGSENFWNQAKRHVRQFKGISKERFNLFLKECQWRFNNPDPQTQLRLLKQWGLGVLNFLSRTAPESI